MIGKKLEPYEIQEILGRGGMGVVYRARDTKLERDVAIKMMDLQFASDPNFLKRFQSEAKALARLQDPHIVSIFNLLETPDGICIVMEYVKGTTLAKLLLPQNPLPIPRVVTIFRQIMQALAHAHKEGVIHRDIKPANIIVGEDDRIKIADFGLAKVKQQYAATATQGTAGTLYYMSPEQFRGLKEVDNRGDIYSAGMTLYECLTGKLPFGQDDSYFTIAQQVVHGRVPPPDTMSVEIPEPLVSIVKRMIACEVKDRYQTADEVVKDLDAFEKSGWGGKPAGKKKPAGLYIGAAGGAFVVILAVAYVMFRPAGNSLPVSADSAHGRSPAIAQSSHAPEPGSAASPAAQGSGNVAGTVPSTGPTGGGTHASGTGADHAKALEGRAPRGGRAEGRGATNSGAGAGAHGEPASGGNATAVQPENGADPPLDLNVDVSPKLISRAEPGYPEALKTAGVKGEVRLMVLVDREGKVQKVRVQSYDNEAFIAPATEAARQSVFSPAIMNNAKVRAWAPMRVRFGTTGE
ncbi:MAG TPA: TonB family protein [Bacteroidota bacterium]|nr:TonB family protein [Bacteroidota bacterium]